MDCKVLSSLRRSQVEINILAIACLLRRRGMLHEKSGIHLKIKTFTRIKPALTTDAELAIFRPSAIYLFTKKWLSKVEFLLTSKLIKNRELYKFFHF